MDQAVATAGGIVEPAPSEASAEVIPENGASHQDPLSAGLLCWTSPGLDFASSEQTALCAAPRSWLSGTSFTASLVRQRPRDCVGGGPFWRANRGRAVSRPRGSSSPPRSVLLCVLAPVLCRQHLIHDQLAAALNVSKQLDEKREIHSLTREKLEACLLVRRRSLFATTPRIFAVAALSCISRDSRIRGGYQRLSLSPCSSPLRSFAHRYPCVFDRVVISLKGCRLVRLRSVFLEQSPVTSVFCGFSLPAQRRGGRTCCFAE